MVVALLAILVLPVGTYFGYQEWGGSMDQVEQFLAMQEMNATQGDQTARMAELADQLRKRLEESPDNADGWAMLGGQTYMRLERYEQAAEAYRRLADVVSEDRNASAVALGGLAAQANYFASEGEMTPPAVTDAIAAARALNPDEVNALGGLMGINAFGQQNYREAIEYWQRITEVAPDHPQLGGAIRGGIEEAYRRLGETPPPEGVASEPQQAAGPGVSLRVSLDEGLRQQVADNTVLFIFARPAAAAGGAPVAVARMTAGDLPAEIRLDDRYAMSPPESAISAQQDVVVVARLSRSGSVNPQPGDWEGRVEAEVLPPPAEAEPPVELVINQELTN